MQTKYYLCIRQSDVVGPHTLDDLREWIAVGAIPRCSQVCKAGEQAWIILSEVHKIDFITVNVQKRLDNRAERKGKSWYSEPATDKQLAKLKYFEMSFDAFNLTKGHASELIDCFTAIDPAREAQYENRAATSDQIERLHVLGVEKGGMTYSKARDLIAETEGEQERASFEQDMDFMIIESMLNDDDVLEICHYRRLTDVQLQEMIVYLNREIPGWKEQSKFNLGKLVPTVFPELRHGKQAGSLGPNQGDLRKAPVARSLFTLFLLCTIAAVGLFDAYKYGHSGDDQKGGEMASPSSTTPTPPAKALPKSTPALTVEDWKRKAIEQYPELAVAGSPLNTAFVAKYKAYRGTNYFDSPDWPIRLAKDCAETLPAKQAQ